MAWRRVRANGGGAGVDGVDIRAFEDDLAGKLARLGDELSSGAYQPRPVRRVFVPKPERGLRPLAIWTLRDRVAQRAVHDFLEPALDARFLPCSHGFRPGRSVDTAVRAVLAGRDDGCGWVLDADIRDCFDSIPPEVVLRELRKGTRDELVLELVARWLRADVLDARGKGRAVGVGQGGPLSPMLCNVALHPFDQGLAKRGIRLVRYADDFVCLAERKDAAKAAESAARAELAALGLKLHPDKTRVASFKDGFKFLGVFFLRREHFYL